MDLASILLIAAAAVLVAIFISRPFLAGSSRPLQVETDTQEHQHSALLAERDRLLTALQELEFDQALGKIPPDDYPLQRAELLKSGAEIYRKLDEFEQNLPETSAEDRLEAAVAARRADAAAQIRAGAGGIVQTNGPAPVDDLERMIAARRGKRQEKSAGFCPKCGNPVQKSDKFCPRCGQTL